MLMLRAFALGALAAAVLAYGVVTVVTVAAMRSGGTFDARVGPLVFASVERAGESTTTVYGAGLLLVAGLGGALNALVAVVIARRRAAGAARLATPKL